MLELQRYLVKQPISLFKRRVYTPGSRTLWIVLLAALAAASGPCKADSPAREDGKGKAEKVADKIVGSWRLVKSGGRAFPDRVRITARFEKDGTVSLKASLLDMAEAHKGTYKVDGNKLTMEVEGRKETETIKALDDKKLVTVDPTGKETEYKRVK